MKKQRLSDENNHTCYFCLVPSVLLNPHDRVPFSSSSISLSLDTSPLSSAILVNNMLCVKSVTLFLLLQLNFPLLEKMDTEIQGHFYQELTS